MLACVLLYETLKKVELKTGAKQGHTIYTYDLEFQGQCQVIEKHEKNKLRVRILFVPSINYFRCT